MEAGLADHIWDLEEVINDGRDKLLILSFPSVKLIACAGRMKMAGNLSGGI